MHGYYTLIIIGIFPLSISRKTPIHQNFPPAAPKILHVLTSGWNAGGHAGHYSLRYAAIS